MVDPKDIVLTPLQEKILIAIHDEETVPATNENIEALNFLMAIGFIEKKEEKS